MNKRIIFIITISAALLLGACAPAAAPAADVTLTDGLGRAISLPGPAETIVSLSPPITEMLFAVGAGEQVVGRDTFSDYPAETAGLPDVGGGFSNYDLETILSLQPDLVIAGEINTPELVQSLEDLDLTVYYLANPEDLDGTFDAIQTVGMLSGHEEQARSLTEDLEARVQAIEESLSSIETRPTVYYELDATDPAKPYTPGPGTFYTSMIEQAGGANITAELDSEWAQISLEFLLVQDPDYILLGDAMWGVTPESLAARPGWDALTAVKEGRVLPFDDNLIVRFGPRQLDGLVALAEILHPEAFE